MDYFQHLEMLQEAAQGEVREEGVLVVKEGAVGTEGMTCQGSNTVQLFLQF